MKTIFTFGLASLIFLVLLSCKKENDILPENARLKQVLSYDSVDAKEPFGIQEEYEYNESGQISKVSYWNYGDRFTKYDLYEYNTMGQLIKITDYYASGDSASDYDLFYSDSIAYSNEGKKVKETRKNSYGHVQGSNQFFYSNGRLSKIENYGWSNSPDQLVTTRIIEYDDAGHPIREVLYGFENVPIDWTINTFSNGLMVKTEIYTDENLENNRRKIYRTFDANKNLKILETYEGPYSSGVGHAIYKYVYFGE